jgi:hypothetical protein
MRLLAGATAAGSFLGAGEILYIMAFNPPPGSAGGLVMATVAGYFLGLGFALQYAVSREWKRRGYK